MRRLFRWIHKGERLRDAYEVKAGDLVLDVHGWKYVKCASLAGVKHEPEADVVLIYANRNESRFNPEAPLRVRPEEWDSRSVCAVLGLLVLAAVAVAVGTAL